MKDSKSKLKQDQDYTIESSKTGNEKTFKIKGKGNYKGIKTVKVKIYDV